MKKLLAADDNMYAFLNQPMLHISRCLDFKLKESEKVDGPRSSEALFSLKFTMILDLIGRCGLLTGIVSDMFTSRR